MPDLIFLPKLFALFIDKHYLMHGLEELVKIAR